VLAETAFHLRNAGLVLEMLSEGFLTLSFDALIHLPQLAALARLRGSTTGSGGSLSDPDERALSHHRVITADKDFRVYRRNKREVIPLICPP